jgi:hypothetical protein
MKKILIFILISLNNYYLLQGQHIKVIIQPQSMLQIQGKTNVNSFNCYCTPPSSVVSFIAESSSETQKIQFKKEVKYSRYREQ